MGDDVLCRENLMDLVYFLRHHKAPQDGPELCDWSCACNGRLDEIVTHDAALRARIEELEEVLRQCYLSASDPPNVKAIVADALDDRARRALDNGGENEG